MATFTGPFANADVVPVDHNLGRVGFIIPGYIDIAANPVAADIYKLCWVPAGFVCTGGFMYLADIDTNATETLDMDMGWAANGGSGTYDALDSDGLGNFGVMNGDAFAAPSISATTGNIVPFSGILATGIFPFFTKKTMIQATCVATCATFTAGRLSVAVHGYVDPSLIVG
jgi:hypothetical protein